MNKFLRVVSMATLLLFLRASFALSADVVYYYYTDPAGTPLAMSDTSGNVVWRAEYFPFGEETVNVSTVQNNKMFVGKEKDSESGLYYFGARYKDAVAGRFGSPDPVGAVDPHSGQINQIVLHDPQRLNSYAYGLNNPYRYIDSDGRFVFALPLFWAAVEFSAAEIGAVLFAGTAVGGSAAYLQKQQCEGFSNSANGDPDNNDFSKQEKKVTRNNDDKPASEKTAKDVGKQIERDINKSARRKFHDMKEGGDRTLQQLKDDAKSLYDEAGKTMPKWLE